MTAKTGTRTGRIYVLSDPRDGKIRYVGKTTQTLDARLVGHVTGPTNPAMRIWINRLAKVGVTPKITGIATMPVSELDAEEQRQIAKHVKAGHMLLNAPHYKRHMSDLLDSNATRSKSKDRGREVFGTIADARAAGTMTRKAAAPRILLRIPFAIALLTWDAVWEIRLTRRAIQVSVAVYGAWTLGFDLLMRRFILHYIPSARLLAFWHTYLAYPMENLGLLLIGSFTLATWGVYADVANAAGVPRLLSASSDTP